MKLLVLIIHHQLKQEAADIFRGIDAVKGFTFSLAEGHGTHSEEGHSLSAHDKVVGYTPHVRVDILLETESVEPVLGLLRKTDLALNRHTFYWVTPVETSGRL